MTSDSSQLPDAPRRSGRWIAVACCALFLTSLWGAWTASRESQFPPILDVLSYTLKAQNVWAEIGRGNFRGLLGVEQTIRPFGTSLLGYPFGYSDDFRAYYWRTLAFPACFCAIGAFFAALAAGACWKTPSAWLLTCFGGMLPMWWSFDPVVSEWNSLKKIAHWGMMDGMQAGVASFAAGLLIYGWRRNIWTATFLSFFLSAFTLLLKPVGVFLIAGHCLAGAGLLIWTFFREPSRNFRRFAWAWVWGIGWCAIICGWCYFSPYFSAANQEMGRQALEQLKAMSRKTLYQQVFLNIIPSLGIYALGFFTLGFWIAALTRIQKISKQIAWGRFVALLAGVVLVLQLAVLYHGTRFQTARYFLPALAVFWIFLSPFLWLLLEKFLWARFAVLANALILTASVWSADFAKAANQVSGYPTFLSLSAIQTGQLAKKSIESSPSYQREPIVYVLGIDMSAEVVSRQLALEAGWEEKVVWKYGPRFWEKHSPSIHPHEIASADFLVTDAGRSKLMENDSFKALSETIKFFNASDGIWEAPVLGQVESITVRKIADQPALEKRLAAHLQKQGLLHFQEVGPSLESIPGEASLASFESGDELVSAHAKWVGDKLQVAATWSGSRDLKRHLQASVALVDSRGVPIHWIPLSLVAPPTSADGLRYRRTIVDDLDCGPFAEKTSGVTLGIYDLTNKCLVRPLTSSTPPIYDRIPVPFMGSSENSKAQSP